MPPSDPDPSKPFGWSHLLVSRAREQAEYVRSCAATLRRDVTISFVAGEAAGAGDGAVRQHFLSFSKRTPAHVTLQVREAINNLRVAIDIAICDVARIRNVAVKDAKFPFAKDEKSLRSRLKEMKIGNDFDDFILDIHPLFGHNLWLRDLHDFDIIMKHRAVVPLIACVPGGIDVQLSVPQELAWIQDFVNRSIVPWSEGHMLQIPLGEDPLSYSRFGGDLSFRFPKQVPFADCDVTDLIIFLSIGIDDLLDDVVSRFGTVG